MKRAGETAAAADWRRISLAMFAVGWGANQFTPMLLVYRHRLGLSPGTLAALFGVYAAGLIPGLLLGGAASDRLGRRRPVVAFVALSPIASLLLMIGSHGVVALAAGRLVAGACSGVVFSAASAWLQELTPDADKGLAARRTTQSLSAGFATGPLVAAGLAQWAPGPLWLPYLPHILLGLVALILVAGTPDTVAGRSEGSIMFRVPDSVRLPRFRLVVAPLAPWVFGSAAIAGAALPSLIGHAPRDAVFIAGIVNAITLGMGVLIQPLARRVDGRLPLAGGVLGLAASAVGMVVGVAAIAAGSEALVVVAAVPLGSAYGLIMVSGLLETERLSRPTERGATIAVYYALTYLGFAAPYLINAVGGALGANRTLALVAVAATAGAFVLWRTLPRARDDPAAASARARDVPVAGRLQGGRGG